METPLGQNVLEIDVWGKLNMILSGVEELLTMQKNTEGRVEVAAGQMSTNMSRGTSVAPINSGLSALQSSPFSLVVGMAANVPLPIANLYVPAALRNNSDLITDGVVSELEAVSLVDIFRSNYGRWTLFPLEVSTPQLIKRMRIVCPLLLSTCCCVLMRYFVPKDRQKYRLVVQHLTRDLEIAFKPAPGTRPTEFLQALVILSIYLLLISAAAASVSEQGDERLSLDPWMLSAMGIATFVSQKTFDTVTSGNEHEALTSFRLYNHLVLVHLMSCVCTGRTCTVNASWLEHCNSVLEIPLATNFDGRMVSEIAILKITYNYTQAVHQSDQPEAVFALVQRETADWLLRWDYLFSQPTLQFVELCYNFCSVLIHYTFEHVKLGCRSTDIVAVVDASSAETREKIAEHALSVVATVATIDNDSYFAYLLDQVHFCLYFSALILLKCDASATEPVSQLVQKYTIVGQNPSDIVASYREGLEALMRAKVNGNASALDGVTLGVP